MADIKQIIGTLAVILVFVAYVPYFRDLLKRKTKPHVYSWFIWSALTFIVFGLQLSGGAGIAAFVTLSAASISTVVFIIALRQGGAKMITRTDTLFLALALITLVAWLVAKQPVISAILATLTEVLGFVPTIRKSWQNPHTETLSLYALNAFRFVLAVLSLETISIVTTLYPVTWFFGNALFALMLFYRRRTKR